MLEIKVNNIIYQVEIKTNNYGSILEIKVNNEMWLQSMFDMYSIGASLTTYIIFEINEQIEALKD